jgi:integrase
MKHVGPYLFERGETRRFHYRRLVPAALRKRVKARVWSRTWPLGTSKLTAETQAAILRAEHDAVILSLRTTGQGLSADDVAAREAEARRLLSEPQLKRAAMLTAYAEQGLLSADDPRDAVLLNALENGGRYRQPSLKLTKAYERDKERYGHTRQKEEPVKSAVDSLVAVAGDKAMADVSTDDVHQWLAACRAKKHKDSTIRRRVNSLRAFFTRYAKDDKLKDFENPFSGLEVGGEGSSDDKHPLTVSDYAAIDSYVAVEADMDTRNVYALMKGTGAEASEIGGLVVADVELGGAIPFVWIRKNELRNLKRPKKTKDAKARTRRIPLVGDALKAARDAVARAKGHPRGQLFLDFQPEDAPKSRGADVISRKLGEAFDAAGVTDSKKSPLSLRHAWKQALEDTGCPELLKRRLMGHAGRGEVHDNYGAADKAPLARAYAAIQAALPHLGRVA